ncbi:hypothetical protein [Stomatohabitans albus]|uniref:hypothetical protein n=1 Tax=Stomatohabitans albus TaxID=3110766 RepID=UPI00300C1314
MNANRRRRKRPGYQHTSGAAQPSGGSPSKADKRNGVAFWGDDAALPDMTERVVLTDDPAAVPRSLGHPPLPGNEVIASNYFEAVHMRAVQFGGALAASAGLL